MKWVNNVWESFYLRCLAGDIAEIDALNTSLIFHTPYSKVFNTFASLMNLKKLISK